MRAVMLWLLILAMPIYGASSTSLRLLGPAHWHSTPTTATAAQEDWLGPVVQSVARLVQQVQQIREAAHLRAHAHGQRHEHSSLQRHWHDVRDGTVHTLDSADPHVADLVAGATIGSATLTLALPGALSPLPVSAANGQWPAMAVSAWSSADLDHSLPPPRS